MLGAKKQLAAGDQLSLDSVTPGARSVSVNGRRQILIEGPLFFDCVLKGYLGAQPSDTALRQSLLAAMPPERRPGIVFVGRGLDEPRELLQRQEYARLAPSTSSWLASSGGKAG